jgi:hypothetical protein
MLLFNPTKDKIERKIRVPLYYTGLTSVAVVSEKEGEKKQYAIDRNYEVTLPFSLEPESYTWFVIE